ncbi:unnamed protein product, partial [marine sediment metagenome]
KITGYNHPKFIATLKWQAERLIYSSSLYSTIPYAILSQKLAQIAPSGLSQAFILNSGSEANESALFMARKYRNNPYIVACTHAYHGRTQLTREISSAGWRTVPESHPSGVRFTPYGYCYRCSFGKEYPGCDFECARYLREVGYDMKKLGATRVMVVTDQNLTNSEPVSVTLEALKKENIETILYDRARVEPTDGLSFFIILFFLFLLLLLVFLLYTLI